MYVTNVSNIPTSKVQTITWSQQVITRKVPLLMTWNKTLDITHYTHTHNKRVWNKMKEDASKTWERGGSRAWKKKKGSHESGWWSKRSPSLSLQNWEYKISVIYRHCVFCFNACVCEKEDGHVNVAGITSGKIWWPIPFFRV